MIIAGYEISLDKIGRWPKWVYYTSLLVAFVVVVAVGSWFYLRGSFSELQTFEQARQELKQQLAAKYKRYNLLKQYENQIGKMEQLFSGWSKTSLEQNQLSGVLEFVSASGAKNNLEFKLFRPLPESPQNFFVELPIEMVVEGRYRQLMLFIKQLASQGRSLSIKSFVIEIPKIEGIENPTSEQREGKLTMSLILWVYRPLPPAEPAKTEPTTEQKTEPVETPKEKP